MKKTIKKEFAICLLCVSVLPVLILSFIHIASFRKFYDERTKMTASAEIEKAAYQINLAFQEVDALTSSIIYSKYNNLYCLQNIAEMESKKKNTITPMERLTNYREYMYICSNLICNNKYVEGVYLFNKSGYTYSYTKTKEFYLERDYTESEWYRTMEENNLYKYITLWTSPVKRITGEYILEICPIANGSGEKEAYIAVVCNKNIFEKVESNSLLDDEAAILDIDGKIVYNIMGNIALDDREKSAILENRNGILSVANGSLIYNSLDVNNWIIVSKYSVDELGELYKSNIETLAIYLFICFIFIVGMVWILEKRYIDPIVRLSTLMQKIPNETDGTLMLKKCFGMARKNDEIKILYDKFGQMINKINDLIQEQYVSEIKLLREKLNGLMAQINSHFLFNTLENINCIADLEGEQKIAVLSKSLGDMLHYSIGFETLEEPLEEELNNIKKYVEIQEIRFDNHIEIREEIPEKLRNCKVLKFILQPLVENAIEHGLSGEKIPWWIKIQARIDGEDISISVENPGDLMEEADILEMRKKLSEEYVKKSVENINSQRRGHSIGLTNIQRRIQLMYSEKYGLEIYGRETGGLKVVICLPKK